MMHWGENDFSRAEPVVSDHSSGTTVLVGTHRQNVISVRPIMRDHLSWQIVSAGQKGRSLKTGSTAVLSQKIIINSKIYLINHTMSIIVKEENDSRQ